MTTRTGFKRQRVAAACAKCRLLKARCDGVRPVCGRCSGYGYNCSWPDNSWSRDVHQSTSMPQNWPRKNTTQYRRQVIESFKQLVETVRPVLTVAERTSVESSINCIENHLLNKNISAETPSSPNFDTSVGSEDSTLTFNSDNSYTYVGKSSDIHFFNIVRENLQEEAESSDASAAEQPQQAESTINNYNQHSPISISGLLEVQSTFPEPDVAIQYLEIYFSTIHIAYPFLSRESLESKHKMLRSNSITAEDCSSIALLYVIFAIGSYYSSFPRFGSSASQQHLCYFEKALYFSGQVLSHCTLENVQMLLSQCFFLLAICQTDRCWNSLGMAIRMGQSIGLHVEASSSSKSNSHLSPYELEVRRRTWYSLFVLDRLLALQLGRPYAIHESDFAVPLPSRTSPDWNVDVHSSSQTSEPSVIDYFLQVIEFSKILGRVIRELYVPTQEETSLGNMLASTCTLDQDLIAWKFALPRHLRFDLGHTFEKDVKFKRQRNMLAIKFHHLRSMVHRPYLGLSWFQAKNTLLMESIRGLEAMVDESERICVSEAQATAHLLHRIEDEQALVHDFPWWQMISCLICAGSILFVASTVVYKPQRRIDPDPSVYADDANTCIKVFEALSARSDAARHATKMMRSLTKLRSLPENGNGWLYSAANINSGLFGASPVDVQEDSTGERPPDWNLAMDLVALTHWSEASDITL